MPVSFRQLTNDDRREYRRIRAECLQKFPDNFGSTFEEESLIPELKFERYLSDENSCNFMFGAFVNNELIGICGFLRGDRNKTKHRSEIVQMYVSPNFAGQNIGFRLLQTTIENAFENAEIEQVTLAVVVGNQRANKIYERVGFVEYGILPKYFKQDETYRDQRFMVLERTKNLDR
jgi:RimJ/RimL family protein N-acetyltransferase